MLQRIRDGLQGQRWLAYLVIGVLALVFAAWGAYGIVSLDFAMGNYAAKAAGEEISVEEAREAWMQQQTQWQQRFGVELPDEQRRALLDDVLEAMVRNTLLTVRAEDLGYRATSETVHEAIRNEPAFQIDGQFNAEVAKARLAQAGISLQAFENELRRSLQRAQIQNAIRASNFLTPREEERLRTLQDQEREVRYLQLPAEKYMSQAPVEDAAVQEYYTSHQARFMTPESVDLRYAEVRLDELATKVVVADSDLRKAYDDAKDRFVNPEKRRARHILIQVDEGEDDEAARKKAEEVLAKAKAGGDFAALARELSEDAGSAAQGGDLGWAERSYFVGPFADALFSMAPGEIRGPVKTQFGYHVIRLEEVQEGTARTFEEARGELEAQLRGDLAADRLGELQEQIELRLEQPGTELDALATELGLRTGRVGQFLRNTGGQPLGNSTDLQEVVFSPEVLGEGRIGGPVIMGEDRIVLVKVEQHRPPAPQPLAEVREEIATAIREERAQEAAMDAAEAARERLAAGASFEDVAKDLGVKAEPARFVARTDPSVPGEIRNVVFDVPKPTDEPIYRAIDTQDGAAVLAVTDLRTAPAEPSEQMTAMRAQQTAARYGFADAAAYVEELRRTSDVEKNPQALLQ